MSVQTLIGIGKANRANNWHPRTAEAEETMRGSTRLLQSLPVYVLYALTRLELHWRSSLEAGALNPPCVGSTCRDKPKLSSLRNTVETHLLLLGRGDIPK